jgi:hypothetical protein
VKRICRKSVRDDGGLQGVLINPSSYQFGRFGPRRNEESVLLRNSGSMAEYIIDQRAIFPSSAAPASLGSRLVNPPVGQDVPMSSPVIAEKHYEGQMKHVFAIPTT